MSGLTTTGATIITDFSFIMIPLSMEAMTQWFGGLGVISIFVVVLPKFGIAGRQLFFAESSSAPGRGDDFFLTGTRIYLDVLHHSHSYLSLASFFLQE